MRPHIIRLHTLLLCVAGTCLSATTTSLALPSGEYVYDAMVSSRQALTSGVIRGSLVREGREVLDKETDAKKEIFYAFTQRPRQRRIDWTNLNGAKYQMIKTPRELIMHPAGSGVITKHSASYSSGLPWAFPRDVRVVGLAPIDDFAASQLEDFDNFMKVEHALEVKQAKDGLLTLELSFGEATKKEWSCKRTFWVDPRKDYSPVRLESAYLDDKEEALEVTFSAEAEYQLRSGLWIPVRAVMADVRAGQERREEWSFEWESVNQKVNPTLFTVYGLDAKGGTLITNNRLGKGIVEDMVPRDGIDDLPGTSLSLLAKSRAKASTSLPWALIINGVIFVTLLVLLIRSRSAKS